MSNRKSQSSFEFLSTYGWAILSISLAIGALYYVGIFNFGNFLPQKCTFSSQFKCLDFALPSSAQEVRFRLLNNIGESIKIDSMSITNNAAQPLTCTEPGNLATQLDNDEYRDFAFTGCQNGAFISGERMRVTIKIRYYALRTPMPRPIHEVTGVITGKAT